MSGRTERLTERVRVYHVPMDSLREGSTLRHDPPWPSKDVVLASEYDGLLAELARAEEYAQEGWAWLDDALAALGAKTVFDIKDRAAELARVQTERDVSKRKFDELFRDSRGLLVAVRDAEERLARVQEAHEQTRELLGPDAAGRSFSELLDVAADLLDGYGGGPVADCLRIKAAALAAAGTDEEANDA